MLFIILAVTVTGHSHRAVHAFTLKPVLGTTFAPQANESEVLVLFVIRFPPSSSKCTLHATLHVLRKLAVTC